MAAPAERQVAAEYVFDRAGDQLRAQAYRILVPQRRARTVQREDDDDHDRQRRPKLAGADTGPGGDRTALGA